MRERRGAEGERKRGEGTQELGGRGGRMGEGVYKGNESTK